LHKLRKKTTKAYIGGAGREPLFLVILSQSIYV